MVHDYVESQNGKKTNPDIIFKEVLFNQFVWTKSDGLHIRCLTVDKEHAGMTWYDRTTEKKWAQQEKNIGILLLLFC